MTARKTFLGIIPARGGSKGIKDKNIREIGGKPMLAWTVEAALNSGCIDRLILSSDSKKFQAVARRFGCEVPFTRPDAFASDSASSVDVVLHALEHAPGFDYLVLLQPTSPLRSSDDIRSCVEMTVQRELDSLISVTPVSEQPDWMYTLDDDGKMKSFVPVKEKKARRQEMSEVCRSNGAVYICRTSWFLREKTFIDANTVGYVMPRERSVDIDDEIDLVLADCLLKTNIS